MPTSCYARSRCTRQTDPMLQDGSLETATYYLSYEQGVILDIRTKEEHERDGHICGANLIPTPLPPLTQQDKQRLYYDLAKHCNGMPESTPIILYCKKGIRANIAKDILLQAGFPKVMVLGGTDLPPVSDIISGKVSTTCLHRGDGNH